MQDSLDLERELESDFENNWAQPLANAEVVDAMHKQLQEKANKSEEKPKENLTTLNLFLKYLDRLYSLEKTKSFEVVQQELRTIESILLTELNASFEQTKKIEQLIK